MRAAARLVDALRDSPTYGLDRANLISAFSIGTAGLLLNGAILMLLAPLMFDPDDRTFRTLYEHVEFGQLLALILLGGATLFATLLIPLRLATVLWGPRVGRYFDQIVLSGISPLRFVIGKATSQNLFLGLILFLLLPHFVLSLTLGGVHLGTFLACLFLVWLYCMALAMVTLWASLYMNELLAAVLVMSAAAMFAAFGCAPLRFQPFVMTPAPALVHPVWASLPSWSGYVAESFLWIFISCTLCLTAVIGVSLVAISLGPLFGIIRENSTFGEVVRAGDSKRKRWFRLRLHIQRPSEIAFFYENRGETFRANEGLIRWGAGSVLLLILFGGWYLGFFYVASQWPIASGGGFRRAYWVYDFHVTYLTIHGLGLALAAFVFSHARNTTYLRIPFVRSRPVEVSRLDTAAFVWFAVLSTIACIAVPFQFERLVALPQQTTVFPFLMYGTDGRPVDYVRVAVEGSLVIFVAGVTTYTLYRYVCLATWLKSAAFVGVAGFYFFVVCLIPVFCTVLVFEVPALYGIRALSDWTPTFAMLSPFTPIMVLFNEAGSRFPKDVSTIPFYVGHGLLIAWALFAIRRRGPHVRRMYLETSSPTAT